MMIPDRLPILAKGKQPPGNGKLCAEQLVDWLVSGRLDLGEHTDHPSCVQPVLNALSTAVNDRLSDDERPKMWPLLLAQPGTARPDMEPVLSVRLACWAARQVAHLWRPQDRGACARALDATEAWCDCPCPTHAAAAFAYSAYAYSDSDSDDFAYSDDHSDAAAAPAYCGDSVYGGGDSAAYAAYAAAEAMFVAPGVGDDALLDLLAGMQAEHARLTGHEPVAFPDERLALACDLLGSVPA